MHDGDDDRLRHAVGMLQLAAQIGHLVDEIHDYHLPALVEGDLGGEEVNAGDGEVLVLRWNKTN
ncbi:MAG TPA: hypothetical protein PKL08_02670, partial [Thermoanaerobaculaceae bacterium]|nr:hypothetical protein [Thermoanaerobaculaceae bacterium]